MSGYSPAVSDPVSQAMQSRHTQAEFIPFWIGVWPGLTLPMLDYVIETIQKLLRTKL
jgi:hypothetical protein